LPILQQINAVTLMNFRNMPRRPGSSLVIVIGIAGVVGVFIMLLAMANGCATTVANTRHRDRAIVLAAGVNAEASSNLTREDMQVILNAPGVQRTADGEILASAEVLKILRMIRKSTRRPGIVALRGIGTTGVALRPEIKVVTGRTFQPLLHELIVGKAVQSQFAGLEIGDEVTIRGTEWRIVGVFESGGSAQESELIGDAETLLSAYRQNRFQGATVRLAAPAAFKTFREALTSNPQINVDAMLEADYYDSQTALLRDSLFVVGYLISVIMAIGAVFAALNTMNSAVSARSVEIATLRAIGFAASSVLISVLAEAMLLALFGGTLGALLVWAVFDGHLISMMGRSTQIVFEATVSRSLAATSILLACGIGFVGGLLPGINAIRRPITVALQTL
jgi:putative ABC transport system permease protein